MAMRKAAVILAVPALLGALGGTAQAEPAAFECSSGYVCFYTGVGGTGDRCQWQNASRQHADDCSWAATTNVNSVYNHGTSTAYSGVCFYRLPNYDRSQGSWYLPQGHRENLGPGGYKVLSHRWVTSEAQC